LRDEVTRELNFCNQDTEIVYFFVVVRMMKWKSRIAATCKLEITC